MRVFRASLKHIRLVAGLFDEYRVFYRQRPNLKRAHRFLHDRLRNGESVVFLAGEGSDPGGFCQLYPTFSSISMTPLWVLNDLYVRPEYRRKGVARALIQHAKKLARKTGAKGIVLETAKDNSAAKQLYKSEGFVLDLEFDRHYWETKRAVHK
jgi:ribosomal protein S18 acetylase RimI-like enzyme